VSGEQNVQECDATEVCFLQKPGSKKFSLNIFCHHGQTKYYSDF